MRTRFKWLILPALLFVQFSDAAVPGGFPSRPIFQNIRLKVGTSNVFQDSYRMYKTSATLRASTTVEADDPDLIVALPVGSYKWNCLIINQAGVVASGFKIHPAFSGAAGAPIYSYTGTANNVAFPVASSGTFNNPADITEANTSTNFDWLLMDGDFTVTVAGNFSIQWAQNVSNAASSGLLGTSSCRVDRMK